MQLKMPTFEQLKTVYAADLTASFPPAELKPLRDIVQLWEDGYYRPWCLFDGGKIVGECFLWLGEPGWALLDFLCIASDCRNGGIGAALVEKMLEANSDLVILGECERPDYAADPSMAKRRLGFYDRNGVKIAGYDTAMFGVPYKTLYWADAPIPDDELMARHRWIYQNCFAPDKYAKHVRIPWDGKEPLTPPVPWNQ